MDLRVSLAHSRDLVESFPAISRSPMASYRMPAIGETVRAYANKIGENSAVRRELGNAWKDTVLVGVTTPGGSRKKLRVEWQVGDTTISTEHGGVWWKNRANRPAIGAAGGSGVDGAGSSGEESRESDMDLSSDDWDFNPHREQAQGPQQRPESGGGAAGIDVDMVSALKPDGCAYVEKPNGISNDQRAREFPRVDQPKWIWQNPLSELRLHSPIHFFDLFFPSTMLLDIIGWTNTSLLAAKIKPIDLPDMYIFFAILLVFTMIDLGAKKKLWGTEDGGVLPAINLRERTGMSRDRWRLIAKKLVFWPEPTEEARKDRWHKVRWLISQFNSLMCTVFCVGTWLCVDESFWRWLGRGDRDTRGCPKIIKEARKPDGVGIETKNTACGASGVICYIEINEGADAMETKEFNEGGRKKSTATTMRLVKNWFGMGKIVCGDSWFASFSTACDLLKKRTFWIGIVKTATKCFPKKFFDHHAFSQSAKRGDTVTLEHKVEIDDSTWSVYAHAWLEPNRGEKWYKSFVCTMGTTEPAAACEKKRFRVDDEGNVEDYIKTVPWTNIASGYFKVANKIDVHNHLRQDGMGLEYVYRCKTWWMRVFCSVFSTIVVNCFLSFKYERKSESNTKQKTFAEFRYELATAMIARAKELRGESEGGSRNMSKRSRTEEVEVSKPSCVHLVKQAKDLAQYQADSSGEKSVRRPDLQCRVCDSKHAVAYCEGCSKPPKYIYGLCLPTTGRTCISEHIETELRKEFLLL